MKEYNYSTHSSNMEVNLNDQIKQNDDPWAFLEKELQEFEKVMRALEEGKFSQKCLSDSMTFNLGFLSKAYSKRTIWIC